MDDVNRKLCFTDDIVNKYKVIESEKGKKAIKKLNRNWSWGTIRTFFDKIDIEIELKRK